MSAFDFLWQGSPPPSVTTNSVSSSYLPDWYQDYVKGIAGKATSTAGMYEGSPVPAQSVAGLNGDQYASFQAARGNVGSWAPQLGQAVSATNQIVPTANQGAGTAMGYAAPAIHNANADVAGPAGQFTNTWQQYMSPYTQGVVDNIARLGVRNWNENIMPGINDQMIGSGQFGSKRNADVLGRAGRDVSADILGQQAGALQQGYYGAAGIQAQDANRQQQQQQIQANTALSGGQFGANTALAGTGMQVGALGQAAGLFSGLGQQRSALGFGDAQALSGIGSQQQQQQQNVLSTDYANNMAAYNQPWDILNNMNSVVRGMQLPSTTMGSVNAPLSRGQAPFGPSALGALGNVYAASSAGAGA